MPNAELEKLVDTSDDWIAQRTGIRERRIAADGQTTSDMAVEAARQAIKHAGLQPENIDGVIVATASPDRTFPAVAVHVQAALGLPHGPAFDVSAACAGFVYGLSVADSMIRCGQIKTCLLIGAEKMSALVDWSDRNTCVLFGDGAGAVVLQADTTPASHNNADRGILHSVLHANGALKDILLTSGGPSTNGDSGFIQMKGRDVFKYAVQYMADVVDEVLTTTGASQDDIDWLVPHQANERIIDATAQKLNLPDERVVKTVARHGNTSAASIPLALAEAVHDGRIQKGDLMLLEGLGAGLTWGGALVRY